MFAENISKKIYETFGMVPVEGEFGIEIETEGRNLPSGRITQTFAGHQDGSLRDGMEYVSSPIDLEVVKERVDNLRLEITGKYKAQINPSYRSSTHIHQNFTSRPWSDVLGTVTLWTLLEPMIFQTLPPGRDGSLFCLSSYDTGDMPKSFERLCNGLAENFYGVGFNPRGKYSSLNLGRLGDLGTLEFRVFPTSLDGSEIEKWCQWLVNIRTVVQQEEDKSYLQLVKNTEQDPFPLVERIFGKAPIPEQNVPHFIDFGARQAYELARISQAALRAKPKEKPAAKKRKSTFALRADANLLDEPAALWHPGPADINPWPMELAVMAPQPQVPEVEVAPAQPAENFQPEVRAGQHNAAVVPGVGRQQGAAVSIEFWRLKHRNYTTLLAQAEIAGNRPATVRKYRRLQAQARVRLAALGADV